MEGRVYTREKMRRKSGHEEKTGKSKGMHGKKEMQGEHIGGYREKRTGKYKVLGMQRGNEERMTRTHGSMAGMGRKQRRNKETQTMKTKGKQRKSGGNEGLQEVM